MSLVEYQKNDKLVSVIVPVYNVYEFLPSCVESILAQTYTRLEIILVNDGSTDRSGELCEAYAEKDSRIRVIHQKNGGLSAARNTGIDACKGEYVCFIDSDDKVSPDYVGRMYHLCEDEKCDIAICNYTRDEKGYRTDEEHQIKSGRELLDSFYSGDHIRIVVAWNKLYRRNVIGDYRYPVGQIHEDESTTIKFLYSSTKIGWMEDVLYYYRIRSGSIMHNGFDKRRLDVLKAYKDRTEFYREKGESVLCRREEQFYLSAILNLYEKLKIPKGMNKEERKQLICEYRKSYHSFDRSKWSAERKMTYFISYYFPKFYALLKRIK